MFAYYGLATKLKLYKNYISYIYGFWAKSKKVWKTQQLGTTMLIDFSSSWQAGKAGG